MLAVAAMAAFSCKQEIVIDEASAPARTPKVVTAYTDADITPDTKTSLDGTTVLWSSTDVVKAYSLGGDIVSSTSTVVSEGGKKAEFTFADLDASDEVYMYAYPAAAVTAMDGNGDVVTASIPTEQTAVAGGFADGANLAVAEGDTNPVFRNVGGFVSIKINNDDIESVKISANEPMTGGSAEVTVDDDPVAVVTGGAKEVCIQADPTAPLQNGATYYAVIYPGTYTGLQIVITDISGRTATYSNSNTLTVGRNANLFIAELTVPDSKWVSLEKGDMWTYTFGSSVFDKIGTKELNGREWAVAGDGTYFGYIAEKGQQFGSGSNPFTTLTLSSDFGSSFGVSDIILNTSGANSIDATVSVSVGGVAYVVEGSTDESVILTNVADDYKFVSPDGNLHAGLIEIAYAQKSSKAMYVKSITVNNDTREQVAAPTFSPAAGVVDKNTVVAISSATAGATIYYTVDGSIPTVASTEGSSVTIDKAMTVKAIAVKDGMRTSDVAEAEYTISGGYPSMGTSNVTLSAEKGTNVTASTVNDKAALKAGTSKLAGEVVITVPANTSKLHLHAIAWNGENVVLGITGATATPSSLTLTANESISGSSSAYLLSAIEPYYFEVALSGITADTDITFTATSGKRFVIWGVNAETPADERQDADMYWSASAATASIEDSGVVFTAPTLTPGHATGITYESTDATVATIDASGAVTVLAAGETTIKAIFAGDATYKPVTVSYVLTVEDNRTPAATTIADVLAGGAGTYEVPDVLVYAAKGSALIIGDATGKMYAYKSSHGLSAGDVRTVNGTTKVFNEVYEFDGPTFTGTGTAAVNHGEAVEFDSVAATLQTAFANPYSAVYVHATGTQADRNITTAGGKVLRLSAANAGTDNKTVEVYGYVYAYSTSYSNFSILVTSIEEYVDTNAPSLSVSPATTSANPASWASGNNDPKAFTVTAENGTWEVTANTVSSWADIAVAGSTITVTPKAAQASDNFSGTITVTLTPSKSGYENVVETIYLAQSKYNQGGGTHEDIVLSLDLSKSNTYPSGFPTASGTATGSYDFSGYTFGFKANTAFYFNSTSGYLMIGKSGKTESSTSYIQLPAPAGYTLTEVSISTSSSTSTALKAFVGSSYTSSVSGDWQFAQSSTSNWTLSGVTAGTAYSIYFVGTGSGTYNGQITALHVKYVYSE